MEQIHKTTDEYCYLNTVTFVVWQWSQKAVRVSCSILITNMWMKHFWLKDLATRTPPSVPTNSQYIWGFRGSAWARCLESVISHKDKRQTITRQWVPKVRFVNHTKYNTKYTACSKVIPAPYPFKEGHFPGTDTCDYLSLFVIDLHQVVIVGGGQCVRHHVSVCKQLLGENRYEGVRARL